MTDLGIINMSGGLGNQLFQYLFGNTIGMTSGRAIYFDISDFRSYRLHEGLVIEKYFEINLPLISNRQFNQISWLCQSTIWKKILYRLDSWKVLSLPIYTDYTYNIREQPLKVKAVEYFFGYWQSQSYTSEELSNVKNLLKFNVEVMSVTDRLIKILDINFERSAAVHFRRGDYVTASSWSPSYVLPINYYLQTMDLLLNERGINKFYVFSDDIEWVKLNFPKHYDLCFIDKSLSGSAGVDLCLMSMFSDIVISNSSFAWWAAALRKSDNGLVLYPQKWVKSKFSKDLTKSAKALANWRGINWNSP